MKIGLAVGRDVRMVECVLDSYTDCPAICPEACICNQMPREKYLANLRRKDRLKKIERWRLTATPLCATAWEPH